VSGPLEHVGTIHFAMCLLSVSVKLYRVKNLIELLKNSVISMVFLKF